MPHERARCSLEFGHEALRRRAAYEGELGMPGDERRELPLIQPKCSNLVLDANDDLHPLFVARTGLCSNGCRFCTTGRPSRFATRAPVKTGGRCRSTLELVRPLGRGDDPMLTTTTFLTLDGIMQAP